jgi:hypothetical protein
MEQVAADYKQLQAKYPQAKIVASTFDAFFKIANEPSIKAQLPVVTEEIGDGWLYGVPSDPLKNAQFREATRLRTACVQSGECDVSSPALKALDRLLIKVPEHTWGVAQSWFLSDNANWTNPQFAAARAAAPPFVRDNANYADYNSTVNSWIEQRTFVTDAPRLVQQTYPALAKNMTTALVSDS